jgi:hypothetical protein
LWRVDGGVEDALPLSGRWLLGKAPTRRIEPLVPLSHGLPPGDDRKIISSIIVVIGNGLRWRDTAVGVLRLVDPRLVAREGEHRPSRLRISAIDR